MCVCVYIYIYIYVCIILPNIWRGTAFPHQGVTNWMNLILVVHSRFLYWACSYCSVFLLLLLLLLLLMSFFCQALPPTSGFKPLLKSGMRRVLSWIQDFLQYFQRYFSIPLNARMYPKTISCHRTLRSVKCRCRRLFLNSPNKARLVLGFMDRINTSIFFQYYFQQIEIGFPRYLPFCFLLFSLFICSSTGFPVQLVYKS